MTNIINRYVDSIMLFKEGDSGMNLIRDTKYTDNVLEIFNTIKIEHLNQIIQKLLMVQKKE